MQACGRARGLLFCLRSVCRCLSAINPGSGASSQKTARRRQRARRGGGGGAWRVAAAADPAARAEAEGGGAGEQHDRLARLTKRPCPTDKKRPIPTRFGQRMTLQLLKVEQEFMKGDVLYHRDLKRTPEELAAMKRVKAEKARIKAERRCGVMLCLPPSIIVSPPPPPPPPSSSSSSSSLPSILESVSEQGLRLSSATEARWIDD
eukprot:COSAG01_NODE_6494_length_3632_cov_5.575149_3_plen_205_part_00